VPYEPFNATRIRSEMLHGPLKREFIEEQGWIPLEESPEGLVIMCVDPEAVRGSRVVPQVFPRITQVRYRVTTQTELKETLGQLFGAGAEGGSIDELLADMDGGPIDDGGNDDSLESAAADNELVKFVNKVIIDAYNQKVSDIHIEPMPGKLKTGIRFRIDGSCSPISRCRRISPGHGHAAQDHVRPRYFRAPQAAGRQDQVQEIRSAGHRAAGGDHSVCRRCRRRGHAYFGGR
jgi:type II secretory ATPase GspE/PulE/Tfp pilus assembly ATPase PilB-like protein